MTGHQSGMLSSEGGYVATPQGALTIWPTVGTTNWVAVDPPRVWDMLQHEDDALGWEQVHGLRAYASVVTAQADRLSRHRTELAQIWPAEQSQAAEIALKKLDKMIGLLRSDTEAAIQNALAIQGIMEATAKAKREVHKVVEDWELTTNDGGPEWWDREATRLSYLTEQTMVATERAIRDNRAQIVEPPDWRVVDEQVVGPVLPLRQSVNDESPPSPPAGRTDAYSRTNPRPIPPSLPGYPPLVNLPSPESGPDLQGSIPSVPATPGQPVSMLPISPGNPHAPYGGAYVLPGPGVGPNGFVVALPPPGSGGSPIVSPARASGAAPGMMPMPMGGPFGQQGGRGGDTAYRRGSVTRWEVTEGVAPVIRPETPSQTGTSAEETEEQFRQWFTQTAMPWRNGVTTNDPAPIVTIRRGAIPS
ncbi:hypothetical protein [Catellatospora citrea]|uniref:PPE family protein n=1 Tax=Catellatospora citrea TaxID=53366 RepID=A0A8J3KE73_9ACTN|nr:hypothetical protein [Catellatospora citrea]RKE08050.1 hypothetical protein C8E86_2893 [Catellatospora citrea]GIF98431.1 hypothetical protein Cci01nite_35250 [Catellatospora citrea]